MILNCTKCGIRYLVANTAIGEEGRQVRCANCGYSWFQTAPIFLDPPDSEAAESFPPIEAPPPKPSFDPSIPRKKPLAAGSNLPVVVVVHTTPNWLKRLCFMLIPLIIILSPFAYRKSILTHHPELAMLYEPFGIYSTENLALADVILTKKPLHDGVVSMQLNCNVINEASGSRTMPAVAATFLDAKGKIVGSSPNLVETGRNLITHDLQPCKPYTFETAGNSTITEIRLDLADPFDLALRRK